MTSNQVIKFDHFEEPGSREKHRSKPSNTHRLGVPTHASVLSEFQEKHPPVARSGESGGGGYGSADVASDHDMCAVLLLLYPPIDIGQSEPKPVFESVF